MMQRKRNYSAISQTPEWRWARDQYKRFNKDVNKLNRDLYISYISRWQSLSSFFSTPCSLQLATTVNNTAGATLGNRILPMYCYDLSSMANGSFTLPAITDNAVGTNTDLTIRPMYRLQCNKNNVNQASPNYTWNVVSGKNNVPAGNADGFIPYLEDVTGVRPDVFPFVERFMHEWSDIRLVMCGAKNRPVRFHVKIIKWTQGEFAPGRAGENKAAASVPLSLDDTLNGEEAVREHDNYWDMFWGHRITNPIRSVRNQEAKPLYKVMYHRTFDFGTKLTTEQNTNADQQVFKLFLENNAVYHSETGVEDMAQSNIQFGTAGDDFGYKAYNIDRATPTARFDSNPFCKGEQGLWLMIYSDNFAQTVGAGGGSFDENTQPSFDIVVRSKHTIAHSPN